ncbi:MAG: hypothetical protein SAK29_13835 [Scytonema sp. PMC 1069.18]|nr:hypothetical protein [Scytonema sp. PMC 1069.18]MEC4886750.1 hypothetical protein [Scytonema sp. PMC 1070.18]
MLPLTDNIIDFQVVRKQPVPEPNIGLSVLAFGIVGARLLLKRKINRPSGPPHSL